MFFVLRSTIRSTYWGLKILSILWYVLMLDFHSTLLHLSILGGKWFNIREVEAELLVSIFQINIGGGRLSAWLQTQTMGRWLLKSMLLAVVRKLILVRARYLCSCGTADVCPLLLCHQRFCTPAVHRGPDEASKWWQNWFPCTPIFRQNWAYSICSKYTKYTNSYAVFLNFKWWEQCLFIFYSKLP